MVDVAPSSAGKEPEAWTAVVRSDVLCVDLDGTLLKTDTLYECMVQALKARPSTLFRLPVWLAQGRCRLKEALTVAANGKVDLPACPRRPEVERLIAEAHVAGKRVELITAADQALVADLQGFGQIFHEVIGSSDGLNLKGEAKARFLR